MRLDNKYSPILLSIYLLGNLAILLILLENKEMFDSYFLLIMSFFSIPFLIILLSFIVLKRVSIEENVLIVKSMLGSAKNRVDENQLIRIKQYPNISLYGLPIYCFMKFKKNGSTKSAIFLKASNVTLSDFFSQNELK